MSPSLVSPIEWLTGGVDSARASADQRLGVVLDQLAGLGVAASGTRGDELGPTAIDDALREFDADHVIISLPSVRKEASQRNKVIDHLLDTTRRSDHRLHRSGLSCKEVADVDD